MEKTKKADSQKTVRLVLALPIFPGRLQPSIVSRSELNFRVRDGNGWTLALISTNFVFQISPENFFNYKGFTSLCQERMVTRTGFEPMLTA